MAHQDSYCHQPDVYDTLEGRHRFLPGQRRKAVRIMWSPDGRVFATVTQFLTGIYVLAVWRLTDGKKLRTFEVVSDHCAAAWSACSTSLYVRGEGRVHVCTITDSGSQE